MVSSLNARASPRQTLEPAISPDVTLFLPTSILPRTASDNSVDSMSYYSEDAIGIRPCGVLGGIGSHVVLGPKEVGWVIDVVGDELCRRGVY